MVEQKRQPAGRPTGGRFAGMEHAEAAVELAVSAAYPELEPYAPIPSPLEGQPYADGTPISASTFEEAYAEFFRPLEDHEAEHGPYQPQPGVSEGELQALAGIDRVNLGRERGTWLEKDEDGNPVIVVHTRNGGGNRDCWNEDEEGNGCGTCTGCIQTDIIPALPTYIRDEDDEDDSTYCNNYFRPADLQAARAVLQAEALREKLDLAASLRKGIASGKAAPWDILTPIHGMGLPPSLSNRLREAQNGERRTQQRVAVADAVDVALAAGTRLDKAASGMLPLREQIGYDSSISRRDSSLAEAAEARAKENSLRADAAHPLPPSVKALVDTELDRLSEMAGEAEERADKNDQQAQRFGTELARIATDIRKERARAAASLEEAEANAAWFHWSKAWPGPVGDCPPKHG